MFNFGIREVGQMHLGLITVTMESPVRYKILLQEREGIWRIRATNPSELGEIFSDGSRGYW